MIRFCIALASVAFWPSLPAPWVTLLLLVMTPLLRLWAPGRWWWPVALGLCWGLGYGQWQLAHRLPVALEQQNTAVRVTVVGLPQQQGDRCRFDAEVAHWPQAGFFTPRRLRLSWYQCSRLPLPAEQWQFVVRLKRPHGYRNPGGLDRELQLLSQGIDATGYVHRAVVEEPLGEHPVTGRLDRWRWQLADRVMQQSAAAPGALVNALLFGDRRHLNDQQWRRLRDSGTLHLFVVSGMHIGLVALALYGGLLRLGRLRPGSRLHIRQWLALSGALMGAAGYAALAGFTLPTQRAWVMVAVLMLGWVSWQSRSHPERLWLAIAAVLVLDPLAIRSVGFWLSFGVAGVLLYAFASQRRRGWLVALLQAQWAAFLGIAPWLLFAFHQLPLLSPLINLFAIPLVTLVLLPLSLVGLVLLLFWPVAGGALLRVAAELMALFDQLLGWLQPLMLNWSPGASGLPAVLLALCGSALLLAPRALPGRWLGVLMWLPLLLPMGDPLSEGDYRVTVLDVGQGSAVLVGTRNHHLLYDSGPRYRSGFSAAEVSVVPYLRRSGISSLDMLMLSHADNDHAGGLDSVTQAVDVDQLLSGEAERTGGKSCVGGQRWRWDGVEFTVLHPGDGYVGSGNNRSCVLRIEGRGGATLLLGDIEAQVERELAARLGSSLRADLLLAAHHGSRTSSSPEFVAAVAPSLVVFSSGYRNRYGHPHDDVEERFRGVGATAFTTSRDGAMVWLLGGEGVVRSTPWPTGLFHYWRD